MDEQNAAQGAAGAPLIVPEATAQPHEVLCDVKCSENETPEAAENKALTELQDDLTQTQSAATETAAKREAERAHFIEWLSLTCPERMERGLPTTQRAFAKSIGVGEWTLSRWKAEPGFQTEFARRLRAICQEMAPDILRRQGKKAIEEGDTPAARLVIDKAIPEEKPGTNVFVPVTVSTAVLVSEADEGAPLPEWAKQGDVIDAEVIDLHGAAGATEKGGEDDSGTN